jgi:integrase
MADLNELVSQSISINNTISINRLTESEISELSDLVVWDSQSSRHEKVCFGDTTFKPNSKTKAVVINTGSVFFNYEIKSLIIAAFHLGTVEGGTPYKWETITNRIRVLLAFSRFISSRGYSSFRSINDTPELKLRSLLTDFLYFPKTKNGLDQNKNTSMAKLFREAVTFLHIYGLVNKEPIAEIVNDLTLTKITKHEGEHRLKHSIIPTGVMKILIDNSIAYVQNAKDNLDNFIKVHTKANQRIKDATAKDIRQVLFSVNASQLKKITDTFKHYKELNLHVYTLALAFTGMRDGEVYALKNNSHSCRNETGEDIYTVKSLLSKTADSAIELDWVANEIVFEAIDVLSKVNAVYHERAKLLLKHHKAKMSHDVSSKMENRLIENRLFGIKHTKMSARFVSKAFSSDKAGILALRKHRIQVTSTDIEQLEKMNCNYQSVSQQSGKRGLKYKVGDFFNFTAHQFRHTFAWFIIANRLGDLDDIKYQFKHLNRVMTFVYSERGYESLSELRTVIEYFEELTNKQAIEDIVVSAKQEQVAGGGGDRLAKFLAKLNTNQSQVIYTTAQQPHFNNTQELIDFATRHSDSVRGLPHGYCTKGAGCKIKNASDPSHCLYCDTYYATPKHLPYWKAIKHSCEQKIDRINTLPDTSRYQSFLTGLEDNLNAANEIISKLTPTSPNNKQTTVES